jgi:hypothetical protein
MINPHAPNSKASWLKFADLYQTKFRVSIRLPHIGGERFMINVDLKETPTVATLIAHICRMFNIQAPSAATVYRDREKQFILALEPDIMIHDLEALQKDD